MRSSSRGCDREADEIGASGARMEQMENYKGLKLCDRLVIEHQQSETNADGGVWGR